MKHELIELSDLTFPTDQTEAISINLKEPNIYLCCICRSDQFCPLGSILGYMTECMNLGHRKIIWFGDVNVDQNNMTSLNYRKLDITMKLFDMVQAVQQHTRIAQLGINITRSAIDVVIAEGFRP